MALAAQLRARLQSVPVCARSKYHNFARARVNLHMLSVLTNYVSLQRWSRVQSLKLLLSL